MNKAEKIKFFNSIAKNREKYRDRGAYYHKELERYLRYVIPVNSSIIEIGCGIGSTLSSLNPSRVDWVLI